MKSNINIDKSDIEKLKSLNVSSIGNKLSMNNNSNIQNDEKIKSNYNNNTENNVKENKNLRSILLKSIRREKDEAEKYEIPKNIFNLINIINMGIAYILIYHIIYILIKIHIEE